MLHQTTIYRYVIGCVEQGLRIPQAKGCADTVEQDMPVEIADFHQVRGHNETAAGVKAEILQGREFASAGCVFVETVATRDGGFPLPVDFGQHVGFAAEAEADQTIPFFMRAQAKRPAVAAFYEIFAEEGGHGQPTLVVYRRYCRA